MAVITPARIDNLLRANHLPNCGSLQPSAMPPPPQSVSPRQPGNFKLHQKFSQYTQPSIGNDALLRETSKAVAQAPINARAALSTLNANTQSSNSNAIATVDDAALPSHTNGKNKSTLSFHASIPHLPTIPDVFTPSTTATTSFGTRQSSLLTSAARGTSMLHSGSIAKRPGSDLPSTLPAKKRRDALVSADELVNAAPSGPSTTTSKRYGNEQEKWRSKWIKSFPTLVFHFELGAEEGPGKGLKSRAIRMGARVDQFFSTKVTHLIVKSVASPSKAKQATKRQSLAPESPKNPFLDKTGVTDLAQKAEALGIKVWTVKKLHDILERLAPVGQNLGSVNSLSTLLEDERLHGTRERDATAPRPDYYYFRPQHKYVLVEDATGKHRTVMVKEYAPTAPKAAPEWPTLFESFLRVPSGNESDIPVDRIRERAIALYVDRKPWNGEQPIGDLKRSTSLRCLPGTPRVPDLPEATPYQNASGNSVVLTSNIASTSNANHSPAFQNGVPQLGTNKGGAILQMSKRVQVLKGNAARLNGSGSSIKNQRFSAIFDPPSHRRASTGASMDPPSKEPRVFMTQEQVIRMLQRVRAPAEVDRSLTVEKRIENRAKVEASLKGKDQDSAPGYCENCRVKYPDLSQHVASKKHRRFAENPDHFIELDALLAMLKRPPNPALVDYTAPGMACWENHAWHVACDLCVPLDDVECEDDNYDSYGDEDEDDMDGAEMSEGDSTEECSIDGGMH